MPNELDALNRLNLGTSKGVLKNTHDSPLNDMMQLILQDVSDQLRASVDKHGISASNNLKQSITVVNIGVTSNGVTVGISADGAPYWKYVNYGVDGTVVKRGSPYSYTESSWTSGSSTGVSFHQSILEWVRNKGVQLPQQFSSYDSFAWAIMRNKIKNGQEPKPFVDDVITARLIDEIREPIEMLIGKSIEIQIKLAWQ